MTDSAEVLGIAPDATLVEIKRAYARALKLNRPDDDAEAFARVHAAFEDCVARFKRREAGISDAPEWYDDDDSEDADAPPHDAPELHDGAPADDDATHADVLAAFKDARAAAWTQDGEASDEEGAPDEASLLVDAILAAAGSLSPWEFDAWLRADERLYDLGLKREVGDRVIGRVAYSVDELPWRTVGTIFHFFEVDSVSDPRLRRDFMAREAWLQVQGDLRFDQELRARRARDATWADRLVMAELFDAPDARRHRLLHLVPMLAGKLRSRYDELAAPDPQRAEAALSPQAREYWLPTLDLSRLHWRRVAMALGQALAVTLPFALMLQTEKSAWTRMPGLWGVLAGVVLTAWLFLAMIGVVRARYITWRMREVGPGEAPAGASIFADLPTAIAGGAALLTFALATLAMRSEKGMLGMLIQVWLLVFMASATFRAPRFRWEAVLSSLAVATLVYPIVGLLAAPHLEHGSFPIACGSFAVGIVAVLLLDYAHARVRHLSLTDLRDTPSAPQCAMAVIAVAFRWLF